MPHYFLIIGLLMAGPEEKPQWAMAHMDSKFECELKKDQMTNKILKEVHPEKFVAVCVQAELGAVT